MTRTATRGLPHMAVCTALLAAGCTGGAAEKGTVGSTTPAAGRVSAYVCEAPAYRPRELLIACGDGNVRVRTLTWSRWTHDRATGAGVWQQNDCVPYCAAGTFHDYPVRLELDGPMSVMGELVFGNVTAYFPASEPDGAVAGREPVTRQGKYAE